MYKEFKATGKEAYGVMQEISGGLGSFFEHQEKAQATIKELEKNPPKGKSLQAQALENILARKQLQQAEYDLRQTLIYDTPPELGAIWEEFQKERAKLTADKAKFDLAQKKRIREKQESWQRRRRHSISSLLFVLPSWFFLLPVLD